MKPTMHYGDMEIEPAMDDLHDAVIGTVSAELVDTYDGPDGPRNLWYVSDGDRCISIAADVGSQWDRAIADIAGGQ